MKRNPSAPDGTSVADDAAADLGAKLGVFAAGWFALIFCYPARAFPLQSFMLLCVAAVAALVTATLYLRSKRDQIVSARSLLPVLLLTLFALWTWFRWRTFGLPIPGGDGATAWIPSPGQHAVITALWSAALALLGWAAGSARGNMGVKFWRMFSWAMCAATGAFALYGLAQYFVLYESSRRELEEALRNSTGGDVLMNQSLLHAFEERRIGGRLGNGNVFAAQLVVFVILGGIALKILPRRGGTHLQKVTMGVLSGFALAAIVLTQSRGGVLTLLFAIGFESMLVMRKYQRFGTRLPRKMRWSMFVVFLVFLASIGFTLRERFSNMSTIRERLNYWEVATATWAMHPVIGSGPGSYELMYPLLKPPQARESKFAHSWVFQTAAETGAVGLGLLVCFVALAGIPLLREIVRGEAAEATQPRIGLSLACLTLAFNGLFEYSLQTREFWLLLAFAGGAVGGLRNSGTSSTPSNGPAWIRWSAIFTLMAAIPLSLAAAWWTWRESMTEFHRWEAQLLSTDGKHAEANEAYAKALQYDSGNGSLQSSYVMSSISEWTSRGNRAETHPELPVLRDFMQLAESLNPLSPSIRRASASLSQATGDLPTALAKMDEAVALYPNDAGYRLDRAEMAIQTGDEAKARGDVKFIVENRLLIWEFQRARFDALKNKFETDPASK